MTTNKQTAANKRNAKLGGVKTAQGKAVSKFNATKHGILMRFLTKDESDQADLIFDSIAEEYQPKTVVENILISRIACWIVRLTRALKAEQEYLIVENRKQNPVPSNEQAVFNMPFFFKENIEEMDKVYLRYESQIERNIIRSLHELQRIQAIRKGSKFAIPMAIDLLNDLKDEPK